MFFVNKNFLILSTTLILMNFYCFAQSSSGVNLKLSLNSFYDNNILKYSTKYIERFKNREDEGRFHINRCDDIINDYSLDISYSRNIIGKFSTIISASIDYNRYSFNTIKNWWQIGFNLQQNLSQKTNVTFSYTHIPDFYVRHYRDADWIQLYGYTSIVFQPFSFSKNEFSLAINNSAIEKLRLRAGFNFARYFHNEHFTEYDCNNFSFQLRGYYELYYNLRVNVGYKYLYSDAIRTEEVNQINSAIEVVDPTYDEHTFIFGADYNLPKIFKRDNSISFLFQYNRRFYKTNIYYEIDPLHAGRNDSEYRIDFKYNIELFKNFSLTPSFVYSFRKSSTSVNENKEYVSNEKDYNQFQAGLIINYKFIF